MSLHISGLEVSLISHLSMYLTDILTDLVTMDWWSELWLNEGFATWVGWVAVDHLYPEWNVWAQFIVRRKSRGMALLVAH
jgi:hypothetical protein